jgi:hypothetical protein
MAEDLVCPESFYVQQTATTVPSGWEAASSSQAVHLDRVAFFLNNPKSGNTLVPDKTNKRANEERVSWTFARGPGDNFWLGCLYTGTTVILTHKLKADVSLCVVRYELLPSGSRLRVKAISCK